MGLKDFESTSSENQFLEGNIIENTRKKINNIKTSVENQINVSVEDLYEKYETLSDEIRNLNYKLSILNNDIRKKEKKMKNQINEELKNMKQEKRRMKENLETKSNILKNIETKLQEKYKNEPNSNEIGDWFKRTYDDTPFKVNGERDCTKVEVKNKNGYVMKGIKVDKKSSGRNDTYTLFRDDHGNYYEEIIEEGDTDIEPEQIDLERVCSQLYALYKERE